VADSYRPRTAFIYRQCEGVTYESALQVQGRAHRLDGLHDGR
jgi:hypothetical protein